MNSLVCCICCVQGESEGELDARVVREEGSLGDLGVEGCDVFSVNAVKSSVWVC